MNSASNLTPIIVIGAVLPADHGAAVDRRTPHGEPRGEGPLMTTDPTDRSADRAAAAIDVQDLHKYFGDNEVLKGIDFHVGQGQVVCVIGPSGSGKSTLLRCVNLLETPTSGQDLRRGRRDHRPRRRRRQAALAHRDGLPAVQPLPAHDGAAQPHHRAAEGQGPQARTRRSRSPARNLAKVGLAEKESRLPGPPLRRAAAARRDRPGAVDGPRHDALRRADLARSTRSWSATCWRS